MIRFKFRSHKEQSCRAIFIKENSLFSFYLAVSASVVPKAQLQPSSTLSGWGGRTRLSLHTVQTSIEYRSIFD